MEELSQQMMANYASQEMVPGQAELLMAHMEIIVARHNVAVLRDALWMHMERSHFMPKLSDLNECVELVLEKRGAFRSTEEMQRFQRDMDDTRRETQEEKRTGVAQSSACTACEGTGFHMAWQGDHRVICNARRGSCPACGGKARFKHIKHAAATEKEAWV